MTKEHQVGIKSDNPEKTSKLLDAINQIIQGQQKGRFDQSLNTILGIILDYLDVEHGSIMVVEGNKMVVRAASRRDILGIKQPLKGDSVAAWVAANKKAIFSPDISKDSRFNGSGGGTYRKNSLLSAPIMQGKKLLGVINATDKLGDSRLLKEDVTYLLNFSSFIISSLVQKQLQEKLKRQKAVLRKKNTELKRQEALRDELNGMLIHDLKTPLSEVVANLDILSYSVSGENLQFLEGAQIACDKTVRMVSNLVHTSRMEDGKMQLFQEEVQVRAILEESSCTIQALAKIKNVQLEIDTPSEGLPDIRLDRLLTMRILQNLLINALAHTAPETTIIIGCKKAASGEFLEFFVKDEGSGIPTAKKKLIFNKYSRVMEPGQTMSGSGLGLYFCKLAVSIQKGSIGVDSTDHQGSRFFFTLPI